jgi:hypothetical protein
MAHPGYGSSSQLRSCAPIATAVPSAERVRGETYESDAGTFRQRLTVVRRGAHAFAVHGERIAGAI